MGTEVAPRLEAVDMAMINISPPPPPVPVLNCPSEIQYGSKKLKLNLESSHEAKYCLYDDKDNVVWFVGLPFGAKDDSQAPWDVLGRSK